jgi:hypothetical protein
LLASGTGNSDDVPADWVRVGPRQLANDITSTFQESLEQGGFEQENVFDMTGEDGSSAATAATTSKFLLV